MNRTKTYMTKMLQCHPTISIVMLPAKPLWRHTHVGRDTLEAEKNCIYIVLQKPTNEMIESLRLYSCYYMDYVLGHVRKPRAHVIVLKLRDFVDKQAFVEGRYSQMVPADQVKVHWGPYELPYKVILREEHYRRELSRKLNVHIDPDAELDDPPVDEVLF